MGIWAVITAAFNLALAIFQPALVHLPHPKQAGIASLFGFPGDHWGSANLACVQRTVLPGEHVCAHRQYRCGTLLILENPRTKKRSWCRVMDHGPYGALDESGTWVLKASLKDPGTWRGIVDLSPAVSQSLGHNGFERILLWKATDVVRYLRNASFPESIFVAIARVVSDGETVRLSQLQVEERQHRQQVQLQHVLTGASSREDPPGSARMLLPGLPSSLGIQSSRRDVGAGAQ